MINNMDIKVLMMSVLMLFIHYSSCGDVQTPGVSLKEHVKKLDETLAEMQAHSQAQEQRNRALLSSLLSQLTQTKDELRDMKTSQKETLLKIARRDAELSDLWENYNATILQLEEKDVKLSKHRDSLNATILKLEDKHADLSKLLERHNATILKLEDRDKEMYTLWARQNETVSDLNEMRANHNDVVVDLQKTVSNLKDFEQRQSHNGKVGFQGMSSKGENVTANKPLIFDRIWYNNGNIYNKSTGKITIPMNGTFQIWIDLKYLQTGHAVVFNIYRNNHIIDQVYKSPSDAITSTVSILYLRKAESIWVAARQNVYFDKSFCHFGIVLLNTH